MPALSPTMSQGNIANWQVCCSAAHCTEQDTR